jgi:hypothetical protein
MKCYLSGMPECRFGMNDKVSLYLSFCLCLSLRRADDVVQLLMDREARQAPGGLPPGSKGRSVGGIGAHIARRFAKTGHKYRDICIRARHVSI